MSAPQHRAVNGESVIRRLPQTIRRAFAEFLKIPALIIVGFLLLAAAATAADYLLSEGDHPLRGALRQYLFRNGQATADLLGAIAAGVITVVSITFSMLLLAVQQAAGALTHEVYDQFLRRRINQVYFGFFVGLAIYALLILATVDEPFNPVFGAALALLFTLAAMVLMIVLLYTTVNQMRPVVVIDKIHDHALRARERQLTWLGAVRSAAQARGAACEIIKSEVHGYVVGIDFEGLGHAAAKMGRGVEIVLKIAVGGYVAFDDELAEVGADSPRDAAELAGAVRAAIRIEQQRDLENDPAYAIEQLAIIAWTSVSTAKSNPSPGLLVLHSLRDLLARWSVADERDAGEDQRRPLPIVYRDDVVEHLYDAFEAIAVVASESMQPQTTAEFIRTFAIMFRRLPPSQQERAESLIRRSLSAFGEHVLTSELDAALAALAMELQAAARHQTAAEVQAARQVLGESIGRLGSRATRVKGK
ncbi:MAG TPA: DUF2254 family protein [Lacipirellula sp.]